MKKLLKIVLVLAVLAAIAYGVKYFFFTEKENDRQRARSSR